MKRIVSFLMLAVMLVSTFGMTAEAGEVSTALSVLDENKKLNVTNWFDPNGSLEVKDGNLIIPMKYLEEGMGGTGAGWYSAGIDTDSDSKNGFSQKYGYFEVRCILPDCPTAWAAFWLMNDGVYEADGSGKDGTEIDIFESDCYGDFPENAITSNLHFDGYGDAHQKLGATKFLLKNNPYEEFNTYGLEWNENEYIFYINGVETFRTDFGGVSQNEEYLILSVEMKGEDGVPSERENVPADGAQFVIDYVKVLQQLNYSSKMAKKATHENRFLSRFYF